MRKTRTRQHIIEDLGFNFVERLILKAGFTVLRTSKGGDYGYDGLITTFNATGEVENLSILFQLKSTKIIHWSQIQNGFILDLSVRDLELWLTNNAPVLIFLYDAVLEVSYCLDLQEYFKKNTLLRQKVRKFVRIYFSTDTVFSVDFISKIRQNYSGNGYSSNL